MRKMTLLFAALLSLASTTTKAETLTADFDSELPAGWSIVGDLTRDPDRAKSGSGVWTSSKSNDANYLVTEPVEGSITFYARAFNKSTDAYVFIYAYDGSVLGDKLYEGKNMKAYSTPSWSEYTADLGDYKGQVAIALNYAAIDDVTYTQMEVVEGPALTVKDGSKVTSPYSYDFGLAAAGTQKSFTLANPGTEDLGVSVSETGSFCATLSATTIAAGSEVTLSVTMPDATGSSQVTITPAAGSGIDPFIINVSGTVRDPNKVYLDFADGKMPEGWTAKGNDSGYSTYEWTVSEGYISYSASSSSYAGTFTSPKMVFAKDEQVFFESSKYGSSSWSTPSIAVEYSLDGETWTAIDSAFTDDVNGTWTSRSVTIPEEGVKYIRFSGWYINLRNIYGGELPNEPNMNVTQPASLGFGMISEATTKTFTIANIGKATLEGINVTSTGEAFALTGVPASLAAGESAEVTITMAATTKGAQSSDIAVSATGMDTVQFTVSGYVLDTDAMLVQFTGNTVPEGWENKSFTVDNDELSASYSAATLTSPAITVAEGQTLAIYAKSSSTSSYITPSLSVKTSTDNGTTWTEAKKFSDELKGTSDYVVLVVDSIAAGNYKLQFEGKYVIINTINGYNYDMNAPQMSFTAEDFVAGKVMSNASKTYTVSNAGTGTLTVNIASDNEKFTVEPAQLVITDEPKTFTVTFNFEEGVYGKFNANITVTPTYDESAAVTFAASAQSLNPDLWEEDFEEGELPQGWVASNWTVGSNSSFENKTNMALAPNSSTAGTLVTPCLTAKEGDVLTWDSYFKWDDEALKVEWSNDNQETWTELYNFMAKDESLGSNSHKEMSFTAPADGDYYLRFTSTYNNGVDNFQGFKLNLPEHIMAISESSIPSSNSYMPSMKVGKSFDATVTIKESRGVNEENVVAKFYMGEEVIGTSEAVTVEAYSTKQITITATPTVAATSGAEMHIEVEYAGGTLKTEAVTRYVSEFKKLELTEKEETEISTGYTATYDLVTLTRSFAKGWNTFVAPVETNISEFGEGAKAYAFSDYADGELKFTAVTDSKLTVATPYIVYVPEAIDSKEFAWESPVIRSSAVGADNIKVTKNGVTFQGTYAPVAAPGMEGKYGVTSAANIAKGTDKASIRGFRAYFELPEGVEIKALTFDGDDATGIITISNVQGATDNVYNLAGQRLQKMQRGINIVNGKKILK